jgi:hypothetical protein
LCSPAYSQTQNHSSHDDSNYDAPTKGPDGNKQFAVLHRMFYV